MDISLIDGTEMSIDLILPEIFKDLYSKLYTNDINEYLYNKKLIDIINDDVSVSSVDIYGNDYQLETTSNDEN